MPDKQPENLKNIGREDFFYVMDDNYDQHIDLSIPYYREMHDEIVRFLDKSIAVPEILDLGCGTGITTSMILRECPKAKVIAIDLFDEMLNHARVRLEPWKEQVTFVKGDFRLTPWISGLDLCVTALALHHILPLEKQALFSKIFKSLKPGGKFLMIDWSAFGSRGISDLSYKVAVDNAARVVPDPAISGNWAHHWKNINIPDTVEDMILWLKEAGFGQAECVFRYYGLCFIVAEKTA